MQIIVILDTVFIIILYSSSGIIKGFYRLPLRGSNAIEAFDY